MRTTRRPQRRVHGPALLGSVLVHVVLVLVLLVGLPSFQRPLPQVAPVMTGSLVESPSALRAEQERQRQLAEQQRLREEAERQARLEAERQERLAAERRAQEEAERQARVEAERKAEAERRAREEAQRLAQIEAERQAKLEAERKAKAEAERQAKLEAERKAKAEAERKAKAEAERKAKAEAERKAREEAEREARRLAAQRAREEAMAAAIAAEENALRAQQDQADTETYIDRIGNHIRQRWVRPAGAPAQFSCRVRIQQSPYGDVVSRSIIQSCGNDFLDNSVLDAVDKASPLPLPRNPRVFQSTLNVLFEPLK